MLMAMTSATATPPAASPPAPEAPKPSPLDAARAFGVTFGGPLVLDAAAAAAALSCARAIAQRRKPPSSSILGVAAAALYATAGRTWMDRWGMRTGEAAGHAIEIDAPLEAVWPWLAQIGQDRGGFY